MLSKCALNAKAKLNQTLQLLGGFFAQIYLTDITEKEDCVFLLQQASLKTNLPSTKIEFKYNQTCIALAHPFILFKTYMQLSLGLSRVLFAFVF